MEQIPFSLAATIGGILITVIGVLWKFGIKNAANKDRECKARVTALETKVADIYTMLIKKSDIEVAKTEQREQRAWERALELSKVLERTSEITRHAIRIIRRLEPDVDSTPIPKSHGFEPSVDHNVHTKPSYEVSSSDETSRFMNNG
jgi:hypothetical protein